MNLFRNFIIITALVYFSACTDSTFESNSLEIEIAACGNAISGVSLDINGGLLGRYKSATAADGKAVITDLLPGSYMVTPMKQGYKFFPASAAVTVSKGASSVSLSALFTYSKIIGTSGIEKAYSIETTSDKGCIIVGKTNTHPGQGARTDFDQYIIKLNYLGEEVWNFRYGIPQGVLLNGYYDDAAYNVKETPDGNFYVVGYVEILAGYVGIEDRYNDFSVIKLDSHGNLSSEWNAGGIAEDFLTSLVVLSENSYVIAGTTASSGFGLRDAWIKKIGNVPIGTIPWENPYGTVDFDSLNDICRVSDGFIFTGTTEFKEAASDPSVTKLWVYKVDNDGYTAPGWNYSFGVLDINEGKSIAALSDGSVIVAGFIQLIGVSGSAVLLKLDKTGTLVWWKQYGGSDDTAFYSVSLTSDGGYIAGGYKYNLFSSRDYYLVKTGPDGTVEWEKVFVGAGGGDDTIMKVKQSCDGGYIVAGTTWSASSNEDLWIMKLDDKGELVQ